MSIFPTTILLATDGSREADLALTTAADLAKDTGSELHLTTVSSEVPDFDYMISKYPFADAEETLRVFEQEHQRLLEEQVRKIEQVGGMVREVHVIVGEPPDRAIVRLGEEIGAGLIVMGSRGRGRTRRVLMSIVSDSVVRHAHCPVLVVRERNYARVQRLPIHRTAWKENSANFAFHDFGELRRDGVLSSA